MSQLSKVKHSREQWKHKATQRGERERYQRKQIARLTAERNRPTQALKAAQARLRQLESQLQELVALPYGRNGGCDESSHCRSNSSRGPRTIPPSADATLPPTPNA